MKYPPKPVTILTGFLGAGKTTFLNEYIQYNKQSKPAIIENEFGDEGIDGGLIIAPEADIFEFNNGCLCCNLNDDLFDVLESLWSRKATFDELIIEATGIANPATIAKPFLTTTDLENYYHLERVICIVDALLIERMLVETEEAKQQIVFSDIIVVNKCDAVTIQAVQRVKSLLLAINPLVRIFFGDHNNGYPIAAILQLKREDFDEKISPPQFVPKQHGFGLLNQSRPVQNHSLVSRSFVFEEAMNVFEFRVCLRYFLVLNQKDIYRIKGIIHEKGNKRKLIVQSVSDFLAISEGEEWKPGELPQNKLVFIGKNLDEKGIDRLLKQCLSDI